ncbi:MAG: hypothetical protein IPJ88_03985 [Myxococcales bacterium]|nr:MAG: hypothetical protein IPJ88_03985 [Myxococcales bacterium]
MIRVSAPGKLMVVGEYSVLEGGEALVAAVSRRLYASYSPFAGNGSGPEGSVSGKSEKLGPETMLSRDLAREKLGAEPGHLTMDSSAFYSGHQKLGFGSSAAAATAATSAVFAEHGYDLNQIQSKEAVFDLAYQGHRAVAAQGSGADVAASVFGGVLRFKKDAETINTQASQISGLLHSSVIWTQQSARTSDFISGINALKQDKPDLYYSCINKIKHCAQTFIQASEANEAQESLLAYAEHHKAMSQLGSAAQLAVVTETINTIVSLAESHHGACKASGAGGGDCCLAFFRTPEDKQSFEKACSNAGFSVLDVTLAAPGARLEQDRCN